MSIVIHMNKDIIITHKYSFNNKKELLNSKKCGCFYCLKIFNPNEINEWWDNNNTAVCPYCRIDSFISENSVHSLNKEFLKRMKEYWF